MVSRELLARMSSLGAFDDYRMWSAFPFSEDRMMGLYAALSGVRAVDFSERAEPFGTKASGLAFSPRELREREHSIVHSVKNDEKHSESEIRAFFKANRDVTTGRS